jgi:hypothetical protein
MSHKKGNQEVMHTVEMQIPAADTAELAAAMETVGDFLRDYTDTLRGEDADTEEEEGQEAAADTQAAEDEPITPADALRLLLSGKYDLRVTATPRE